MSPSPVRVLDGTLADGTPFEARCPAAWNGYLLVQPDLWRNEHDDRVEEWLLAQGYASLRHSREIRKWNLSQGVANQNEALERFEEHFRTPDNGIIATGASMSGLLTRILIEKTPERYIGALPMDGGGGGVLAPFDRALDMTFVLTTLLEDDTLGMVDSLDPADRATRIRDLIRSASTTAVGRARLALAAAVGMMPVWNDPMYVRPDPGDPAAEVEHLARGMATTLPSAVEFRAFLDTLAGGAICTNEGVDYTGILSSSGGYDRVQSLYDRAESRLSDDLARLESSPRYAADAEARSSVLSDGQLTGVIRCPTLILKGIGDPDSVAPEEAAYRDTLLSAGTADLARNAWVDTAGHVNFSVAERVTAISTLVDRIETGSWRDSLAPLTLKQRAESLNHACEADLTLRRSPGVAPQLSAEPSRFVAFAPPPLARSSVNARSHGT